MIYWIWAVEHSCFAQAAHFSGVVAEGIPMVWEGMTKTSMRPTQILPIGYFKALNGATATPPLFQGPLLPSFSFGW